MTMRVALIGAVGHVNYVLDGIREFGDAELCAVAPGAPDEDGEAAGRLAEKSRTATYHDDWRVLLDRENIDVVAVAPRFHRHARVVQAALERGLAVYCEKPLALTIRELDAVRSVWEQNRRPVGMMLAFRYEPSFYTARRLVGEGVIGRPTIGYAQKSYKRGDRPDFYKRRKLWGGIIPWVGIHAIDWTRWVSGCRYAAVTARHIKMHAPGYPEMEDAATCMFELDNGGGVVMSFDFLRPAGAPSHGDDRLRLLGDRGAIEVRGTDFVEVITPEGVESPPLRRPPHGPFADFLHAVCTPGHTCLIPPEDAFRVTEIALRAREAADSGRRVQL